MAKILEISTYIKKKGKENSVDGELFIKIVDSSPSTGGLIMDSEIKKKLKEIEDEDGRKELAIRYETEIVGTKIEPLLAKLIDDGEKKTLDYYLGAERVTLKVMAHFPDIGISTTSQPYGIWAQTLAYISHKIVNLQERKAI